MKIADIRSLMRDKKIDQALREIDAALTTQTESCHLWNMRGDAIQMLDHLNGPLLEEVEKCYLKALEVNPRDLETIESLAHYYDIQNQPDQAKQYASLFIKSVRGPIEDMNKILNDEY